MRRKTLSSCGTAPPAKDGESKLAKWSFVPSGDTVLFDQADYLCYALLTEVEGFKFRKDPMVLPRLEYWRHN